MSHSHCLICLTARNPIQFLKAQSRRKKRRESMETKLTSRNETDD